MKMKRPRRLTTAQYKRASVAISALLVILLIAYAEVIRPNVDASNYIKGLDSSSKPLESCFTDLAETTQLQLYYAPDIALSEKRQDTATILKQIDTCRKDLASFEDESHQLTNLHFSGFTTKYRQAKVYQRQAFDVAGQSKDVLNQYNVLAGFLSSYYDHIIAFSTYNDELAANKFYLGSAQLNTMAQQAADLRQRATQIRELDAPAEFNKTKLDTATMMANSATGFENVVNGYRIGSDQLVETGYNQIDQAAEEYSSTIINLPFTQLTKSYIPKQVAQLPAKVANLLTSASE
jgi:hypothetical protein